MSDYGVRYKKIVDYLETHPYPFHALCKYHKMALLIVKT
jgi:hypothetical protein